MQPATFQQKVNDFVRQPRGVDTSRAHPCDAFLLAGRNQLLPSAKRGTRVPAGTTQT